MENNATIGQVTDSKDEGLLSIDDLITEIGKLHVEKMGLERRLNLCAVDIGVLNETRAQVASLTKSNKAYQDNNVKLDEALTAVRREEAVLKRSVSDITKVSDKNKAKLDKLHVSAEASKNEISSLHELARTKTRDNEKLSSDISDIKIKLTEVLQSEQNLKDQITALSEENDDLIKSKQDLKDQIDKLSKPKRKYTKRSAK